MDEYVMRRDCDTCKHDEFCWQDGYCDDCLAGNPPSKWEAADYYEPDTRAEYLRRLNDEELAKFLTEFNLHSVKIILDRANIPWTEKDDFKDVFKEQMLDWLQGQMFE